MKSLVVKLILTPQRDLLAVWRLPYLADSLISGDVCLFFFLTTIIKIRTKALSTSNH